MDWTPKMGSNVLHTKKGRNVLHTKKGREISRHYLVLRTNNSSIMP